MAGGYYWIAAVLVIAMILILGGMFDLLLYSMQQPTVTDFLRRYPLWFIVPSVIMFLFLIGLGVHLFAPQIAG